MVNNSLVSDYTEVCNIINDFYINIEQDIGINNQSADAATTIHPSIQAIKDSSSSEGFEPFDFKPVSKSQALKFNDKFAQFKKDNRCRSNSTQNSKSGSRGFIWPDSRCSQNQFPDRLKVAQVSPIFKKGDSFIKKNYRPANVLITHLKIFEQIKFYQLSDQFGNIFIHIQLLSERVLAVRLHC